VVEKEAEILPGQDRDLASPAVQGLLSLGVQLLTGVAVAGSVIGSRGVTLELADGRILTAPAALVTGLRHPNLPEGLEASGARLGPGGTAIAVDGALQTSCPGLYAIGDINGLCGMAHAAIEQGLWVARHLTGSQPAATGRPQPGGAGAPRAYAGLARALFTLPEIAGAGLQERELAARGLPYRARRVELAETWRGLAADHPLQGFAKILSAPEGKVLGVWICAENASEMAGHFGLLLNKGLSTDELLHGLPIHPTLGEALLEAALRPAAPPGPAAAPRAGTEPQDPA
jgi:dihydrolipoamide dehydrogenase